MAIEHRPRRTAEGGWEYPRTEDVLRECGLRPIAKYIETRRTHIAAWVVGRPLYHMCEGGERRRGSSRHQYWWEQPLDLEEEEGVQAPDDDEEEASN